MQGLGSGIPPLTETHSGDNLFAVVENRVEEDSRYRSK